MVLYWQQNADDSSYSLAGKETLAGQSGTTTNFTGVDGKYSGFHLSTVNSVVQQTIAGDGSTIVNVYYDRNEYQVKFYTTYASGEYENVGDGNGNYVYYKDAVYTYKYVGEGKGDYDADGTYHGEIRLYVQRLGRPS